MKKHIGNLLGGLALVAGLATSNAAQAGFSTTEVQLHYGDGYKMGRNATFANGFSEETVRQTITLDHFSTNEIGDLFFFVDFFRDTSSGTGRESDQYGEIYYHLHGSNIGLTFDEGNLFKGLDLGVGLNQGTDFSVALAGPRLSFNVPGFKVLSLGIYAYENFVDVFDRKLDTTYHVTIVWDAPFAIGSQKFQAKGFVDFIGSQGNRVARQIVFSPQVRWDIGNAMGMKENKLYLGIEYTHFDNKFGNKGVDEDSASIFLGLKF